MKRSFTKLLLALSLVINPVAVLASDFHEVEMKADLTTKVSSRHHITQEEVLNNPTPHDNVNCEMPCCEDSDCSEQGICFIQYNSDVVAQNALRFSPPLEHGIWGTSIAVVPDRELPPENPPPIHI